MCCSGVLSQDHQNGPRSSITSEPFGSSRDGLAARSGDGADGAPFCEALCSGLHGLWHWHLG